ncbi:MAG: hypothetical protein E6R06_28280, partial [Mycobacterium sp.]
MIPQRIVGALLSVATALTLAACDAKTPDYKSIWSTTPTTTPVDKASLIPFPDYLNKLGVQSKQVV